MEALSLDEVFSPATPITRENFFIGRFKELQALQIAASEPGKHILLFGERGVGKTSLTNMLIAKSKQQKIIKKSAYHGDTFSSIWNALLSEMQSGQSFLNNQEDGADKINFASLQTHFSKIREKVTFIIDEFDLIANKNNRKHFASLIKYLSDNHPNITLVLVGIAGRASDLIDQHSSLERCFIDFNLPLMSDQEITDLVELGGRKAGFNFHTDTLKKILVFSSGYPYYAHMIAKFSCMHASNMHYKTITVLNYNEGIKLATLNLRSLLDKQIAKAIRGKNLSYKNIAEAAAMLLQKGKIYSAATSADETAFSAAQLISYLKQEKKEEKNIPYYLKKLTSPLRGELLQPIYLSNGSVNYRFKNPLVKNFLQKNPYGLPLK